MKQAFLRKIFIMALSLVWAVSYMPRLLADENTSTGSYIDMIAGDIQTVSVKDLTRVSVTNPDVADISDAQSDEVSLLAKKAGETVLFLWDARGKHSVKVRVVNEDLSAVKARVQRILDEANITGITLDENMDEGKVVVLGELSKDDRDRVQNILQPYSDNLLMLVREAKNEDLVQVDMQIVEISTSLEKDLGVLWNNQTAATSGTGSGSSTTPGLINENENIPSTNGNGKFSDFFKVGGFARTPLQASLNAFIQEGKARLISKPRLVVMSGKQASFLVGGEIPTLTTTSNTTGSTLTQNTTYTQYGVNVTVTPTIREGKIDVLLNVDIRDIDAANSSTTGTAFITRTASTNLFMDNKQTIVLAGLIKYTDNETVTRVPFLSKIPLLGELFTNRQTPSPDTNTEMVIILTPMVLTDKKFADNQVVMPTPGESSSWNEINSKYEHEPLTPSLDTRMTPADPILVAAPELPIMTAYARMVQEKISKAISYPVGEGASLSGTVKLKLHILKDGSLDSAEVMESSGNNVLDQEAMQAAKTAAPFDAFAMGMNQEGMIFTIPIVYNKLITESQSPTQKVVASY
jgi:pilus assembly protein CpaC